MENYAAAKAMLFDNLSTPTPSPPSTPTIPGPRRMIKNCPAEIIRFGFEETADYRARDIAITAKAPTSFSPPPTAAPKSAMQLIGKHNIENALAAAALVGEVFGLSVHQLAAGLKDATGAPGRLQAVRAGQPFAVLVDYAHTDDALENVLTALRPLTRRKLRVLFGCGGDRDRTKRPRMATVAEKLRRRRLRHQRQPPDRRPQIKLSTRSSGGFTKAALKRPAIEADRRLAIDQAF